MTDVRLPRTVHLNGSIGLDTVEEVFKTCGAILGARMKRVPDGEPGGRRLWISWQAPVIRANPYFVLADPSGASGIFGRVKLAEGVKPEDVRFGELGYSREAKASYQDFVDAKARGDLPETVKFQVSLPPPYAVLRLYFSDDQLQIVEPAYERAMLAEVDRICAAIPHDQLAIQWDICIEMCIWDGQSPNFRWTLPGDAKEEIVKRIKRLSEAVPADVELGFHLCYGDLDAKHFFNPVDTGAMVDISNAFSAAISRPINWIHMPVPIDRSDDAFFAPLTGLKLHPETEVYLGLVHSKDGVEGTKARIRAAQGYLKDFGVATECGMGRARTAEVAREMLQVHAEVTEAP